MRSAFSSAAVIFAVACLASAQTIDPDSVSIEDRSEHRSPCAVSRALLTACRPMVS